MKILKWDDLVCGNCLCEDKGTHIFTRIRKMFLDGTVSVVTRAVAKMRLETASSTPRSLVAHSERISVIRVGSTTVGSMRVAKT